MLLKNTFIWNENQCTIDQFHIRKETFLYMKIHKLLSLILLQMFEVIKKFQTPD